MRNKLGYFILLPGLWSVVSACAESASEKITTIEAETLVLKAREKQLDVQASIISKQNEIAARQAIMDQLTHTAVAGDPVIRSIEGIGRTLFATLQLSNGSTVDAQVGDILPNGMRIVAIRPSEVIAENEKKRLVRLTHASQAPTQFNANYPGTGLRLPPPLPLPSASPPGAAK